MAGPHQWVRLLADDFSATVSASSITSHQGSHLANLLELGQSAEVRLDCDAATAKEVTAVLRQGASYVPPTDAKLVAAAQHQLNYLGIPWQQDRVVPGEEVVWVPHYQLSAPPEQYEPGSTGLLIYSKAARGWANITGQQDPFKASRAGVNQEGHSNYYSYLAGVLRAEATGAGEDIVYMMTNENPQLAWRRDESPLMVRVGSFQSTEAARLPQHEAMYHSAMTVAKDNLYLLGGQLWNNHNDLGLQGSACRVPFHVYRPQLNAWFSAASPLPDAEEHPGWLSQHCLVTNQQEGMLLALGGGWRLQESWDNEGRVPNESVFMYDITSGRWNINPSGCKWHRAGAVDVHLSAVALDPFTVMVLSHEGFGQQTSTVHARNLTSYVDLLDLRMWRWRSGAQLQVETCKFQESSRGMVKYDNAVLAVGGTGCSATEPYNQSQQVHAYDPRTDSWSEMPLLPFHVHEAQPVVVRMPNPLPAS